jgi:tetratricopeptide (TPR) repeat protein
MPQEVIHLSVRHPLLKIVLILLLLAAGLWSYYVIRWYLGNTLAEYSNPADNSLNVPQIAESMAPQDPMTHWRIAQVSQKILPLDQQGPAIVEYEKAVSLSPYDYRFWMALGVAQEQAGDPAKAEQALKRAVALAPAYAYPHWYLGNLLLRNNRYDEAFAELRLASQADPELQPQQFNLIWAIYSNDPEGLKKSVGSSAAAQAQFALYLLGQKHYEEGLPLWNRLSPEEKKENKDTAQSIVTTLNTNLRFHDAMQVWNEVTSEKFHVEVGRIFDASFEEPLAYGAETVFGWQVKGASNVSIGIDPNKGHDGARSLRFVFQVRNNIEGISAGQLVPVAPNSEYDFEYYISTDKLESGSAPFIQIADANTGAVLATSQMAPGGTNDWNRVSFSFKTGDKTEAVNLRIMRTSCGTDETPVCPIFGSVWYDDFSFKRRS